MFGRTRRNELQSSRRHINRGLRFEGLEDRTVFANDVTVALAANVLTITGDVNPNQIEITFNNTTNAYIITGLNGTNIIGSSSITDPFDTLHVDLGVGSDNLKITGAAPDNRLRLGVVNIDNGTGNDVNTLTNVLVQNNLTITKIGDGESSLTLDKSEVVGDLTRNAGGFNGQSMTIITGDATHLSTVGGNVIVNNNDGEDFFIAANATINGDVTLNNGNGDTETTFGMTATPTVWGAVTINNGDGFDKLMIGGTDVWGTLTVNNGDGHTVTTLQTADVGLGAPVGDTGDLTINNGAGFDTVSMTASTVRDDLVINNGIGVFGSKLDITQGSRIGDDLDFNGDTGTDTVNVNASEIVDSATFNGNEGSSEYNFTSANFGGNLTINGGGSTDKVLFTQTIADKDVMIALGGGVDNLSIVNQSQLRGSTSLMGGGAIDTFNRQVSPDANKVVIAFLAFEDFEIDTFNP